MKKREYIIWHLVEWKAELEPEIDQKRIVVGTVMASSLSEAFKLSNNIEDSWNKENPCRSTSIGDVIQQGDNMFMVRGTSFLLIPNM